VQSKHDLKGKDQLLVLIRRFPEGLAVVEVKDAYPNVLEDLQVTNVPHLILKLMFQT
jgi:transcription initiation factor TFIIE subunit beta